MFKVKNDLSPKFVTDTILQQGQSQCNLRCRNNFRTPAYDLFITDPKVFNFFD